MATDGDAVVGFVGLDDLSLDMAASLLRAGYKVQAFEVITRKVFSLPCFLILLLNFCCLVAENNMEGHFHFVWVSWKKRGYDREKASWRAVCLGRIQFFYFFCFDLLQKYLVKNLVLMGRGRGIGSGRA